MRRLLGPALALLAAAALMLLERRRAAAPAAPLAPVAPPSVVVSTPAVAAPAAVSTAPAPTALSTAAAEIPLAVPPPAPEPPQGVHRLRIYGVVYDLVSLRPVAGARLHFALPDLSWDAQTDAAGHYVLDMPHPDQDWRLTATATAPGYRPGQMEDTDPPMLSLEPPVRRLRAEETAPSDLEPVPVKWHADDTVLELDLVLVRERRPL